MAVLIEAISVIVRVQAVHNRYAGGWQVFVRNICNQTFCSDNELARIGSMTPDDCKTAVDSLEHCGLIFLKEGRSRDLVVADQLRGFTVACDWANFTQVEFRPRQTVSAAELKGSITRKVFCPDGWKYEGSLSQQFGFVPSGAEHKSLKFLRREQHIDVYVNLVTGKEVYIGRADVRSP